MKVRDPRGQTWRVTRRWVPWRRRVRDLGDGGPDLPALGDDPISLVLGLLALVLLIPFLVLAFVAVLEVLLLLLVLPFAVLGRVLLGRHWTIEARRGFTPVWEEQVGDWASCTARIEEVSLMIEAGRTPPTTLGARG